MSISKQLINGFVESELKLFKNQFNEKSYPEIQDYRSLAIAWVCYYFKDSINNENSFAIIQFVDDVYSKDNYNTHGWYRISALQAAAFILTADMHYASSLIQHIGCMQGWARGFIIESVGIICPLLSFDNKHLKKATETNIKYSHGLYEENIILFLSTKGTAEEKLNWLENQISIDEKDYHKEFYMKLKTTGKYYQCGFFVSIFNKAKSYFIFKLMSKPTLIEIQPGLFDSTEINFEKLNQKEKEHPLADFYIDLSFLNTKQL